MLEPPVGQKPCEPSEWDGEKESHTKCDSPRHIDEKEENPEAQKIHFVILRDT